LKNCQEFESISGLFLQLGNKARHKNSTKNKVVCFEEEIAETKATSRNSVLGSGSGEDHLFASKLSVAEKECQDEKAVCFNGEITRKKSQPVQEIVY
jgi:hypothetical protein